MIERAIEMLTVAKRFVGENDLETHTVFYDDTECDGGCVADDCGYAANDLEHGLDNFDWDRIRELSRGATPGQHEVETLCTKLLALRG